MRERQTKHAAYRGPARDPRMLLRKGFWLLAFSAVNSLFPVAAHAGPIVVNHATACGTSYTCTPIVGLSFSSLTAFRAFPPTGWQATLHFTNMSGVNWKQLTLVETGVPAAAIACTSNLFACSVISYGSNGAQIVLNATGTMTGIRVGQSFEIACNGPCPTQVQINAVAASEPSGLLILFAGLAAVFAWKMFSLAGLSNRRIRRSP